MSSSEERRAKRVHRFRELGRDRIEKLNLLWFEYEQGEADAAKQIMRELHTHKGEAALTGFVVISEMTHALEDALGHDLPVRSAQPELGDLYFETLDLMGQRLEMDPSKEADREVRDLLARLQAVANSASATPYSSPDPAGEARSDAVPSPPAPNPAEPPTPPPEMPSVPDDAIAGGKNKGKSLRVRAEQLDQMRELVGELVLSRTSLLNTAKRVRRERESALRDQETVSDRERVLRLERSLTSLESSIRDDMARLSNLVSALEVLGTDMRMVPIGDLFGSYPRYVRELSKKLDKKARLEMSGDHVRLDREILTQLDEPMLHLLRNAIDHGLESPEERLALGKRETGMIRIATSLAGNDIEIRVSDDGEGIDVAKVRSKAAAKGLLPTPNASDDEVLQTLLAPGMTTRESVTTISGRGIGLDVVNDTIQALGGSLQLRSQLGNGTTFILRAPLSAAISSVLTFRVGRGVYAVPASSVHSIVSRAERIESIHGQALNLDGRTVPIVSLGSALGEAIREQSSKKRLMLIEVGTDLIALADATDHVQREAVLRPCGNLLQSTHLITAGCPLGDGDIALLINPLKLRGSTRFHETSSGEHTILVVDDSPVVRDMLAEAIVSFGMEVVEAGDGAEALSKLDENPHIGLVVTDLDMPNIDGLTLVRAIRRRPPPRLPAIVVSARGSNEDKLEAIQAGADGYIVKSSFSRDGLLNLLNKFLSA